MFKNVNWISWPDFNSKEIETNSVEPTSRYEVMTDGTLMIHNTQHSDQGVYECVARNSLGEVRTDGVQVRTEADPNAPGQWQLTDYADLQNGEIPHENLFSSLDVDADQNQQPFFGNPNNQLENRLGQRRQLLRPRISIWPQDGTFVLGDTLELHCQATGNPTPDIKWEKNDLPLPFDPRITVSLDGILTIENLRNTDRGLYRCTASNSEGRTSRFSRVEVLGMVMNAHILCKTSLRHMCSLPITDPPEFTQRPINQEIVEGHSAFFSCDATGEPLPTMSWTKDGDFLCEPFVFLCEPYNHFPLM